jgi:hypothetical protein
VKERERGGREVEDEGESREMRKRSEREETRTKTI